MRKIATLVLLIALAFHAPLAHAMSPGIALRTNALYTCTFQSNSSLYVLRASDGAATLVGPMGVQCVDLAFYGSKLYGVSFSKFLVVNPTTGAVKNSYSHGFNDLNSLVVNASGKIFAAGSNSNNGKGGNFVTINRTTGNATLIGRYGNGIVSAGDLAFKNGILYATVVKPGETNTWLAKINVSNGRATLIGDIGYQDVWGLALRSGIMYAVTQDGNLLRINTNTGRGVLLGNNGLTMAGLAKSP